jgi:membrane protease YdiL (CAAX protease family)
MNLSFCSILSDKTDITERAVAFSLIIGLLALSALVAGIAFALLSGGALSYSGLIAVGALSLCFVLVYVWMVLPESLPVSSRRPYTFVAGDLIPTRTISLLRATPGLFRLTITLVLQAVAMYGLQAMRAAYAQNTYGLTPQDLAILGAIMGISIVVVQVCFRLSCNIF